MNAVRAGLGVTYMPEDLVKTDVAQGRLIRVLDDWCAPFSGYHLYYPSRRQPVPAFALLVVRFDTGTAELNAISGRVDHPPAT